jgi:eukaryotic-like serine/threonine-protein kinase
VTGVGPHENPESAELTLIAEPIERSAELDGGASQRRRERKLQRGDEVGRYVILERVGAGGMGVVYAAWDPKLDRKVALKLLHAEQEGHGQRLEREAQAMARLSHPNVIAVHDVGEVDGRVFVAMDFIDGETLGSWAGLERKRATEPDQAATTDQAAPRSWAEILDVMIAAGRGLAAAHAQGLIHRDFKPDNVMIGADARVYVMDFGLVRAAGELDDATLESSPSDPATRPTRSSIALEDLALESSSALESQLTLAGSLLGTPAYMAPEQLRGDEAGARADQFAFCVAVWECLYGERPFAGDSPLAVLFSINQGKFSEPPPGRAVPSWVRRALERGLALEPSDRWPDMPSLLAALADDPKSKRRPWVVGGAALALAGAVVVAALLLRTSPAPAPPPCEHAGDELRELWTSERRAAVEAAFGSSTLVYAGETWDRVGPRLDDWASGWIDARKTACEDTEVRREQSAELLDLRMACLDQRRDRFAALVELFAAADDTVIENAVEAVDALPSLEICADRSWLMATVRPPEDPQLAAAVAELREDLARVETQIRAGKAADARALALHSHPRAVELDWPPVIAEASFVLGHAHQELGEFTEAHAALEQAFFTARRSRHDEVTVQAAYVLAYVSTIGLGKFESAATWLEHALAEADRIGRTDLLAEVHTSVGIHHYATGDIKQAAEAFARALELFADGRSVDLAMAHINYGTILVRLDLKQRERAFAELDRGLAMLESALGPHHPHVAGALSNYATTHGQLGEYDEAIAMLERALEINEAVFGDEHPMTALVQYNLATNYFQTGELEPALEFATRSLAANRALFGDSHIMVAQSERRIGSILHKAGKPAEAIPHIQTALAIWEALFDDAHAELNDERVHLARSFVAVGRRAEALELLERVLSHEYDEATVPVRASMLLAEQIVGKQRARALDLAEFAERYYDEHDDEPGKQRIAEFRQRVAELESKRR